MNISHPETGGTPAPPPAAPETIGTGPNSLELNPGLRPPSHAIPVAERPSATEKKAGEDASVQTDNVANGEETGAEPDATNATTEPVTGTGENTEPGSQPELVVTNDMILDNIEELETLPGKILQAYCEHLGLPTYGTKAQMAERIREKLVSEIAG